MTIKTIKTLEDIKGFKYDSGDCHYNISNDYVLYYNMIWGGRAELGLKEEFNMLTVMEKITRMGNLRIEEKQEIWDTVVYLSIKHKDLLHLTMGAYELPADALGNYSLVREWDKELMRYNFSNLYNRWVKVHNFGGVPRWDEFKDFYAKYKEKLNRKHYILLSDREMDKLVVDMKPIINNITYKKGYGYEGLKGQKVIKTNLYDIDDLIKSFEEKVPNILNKQEENWLTEEEKEELRLLCGYGYVPQGLNRFGDIIFDYKYKV